MGSDSYYEIEPEKKKRSALFWILSALGGIVLIFGLGSCVMMFGRLFQHVTERQIATTEFLETALVEGLPNADSGMYHPQSGVTDENLIEVQDYIRMAGPPKTVSETGCNVTTKASTNALENGTLAQCRTDIEYAETDGFVFMIWKLEGEDWKILNFNTQYDKDVRPESSETDTVETTAPDAQ